MSLFVLYLGKINCGYPQTEASLGVPLYTSLAGREEHLLLEAWAQHLKYKSLS